jgi:hypothetical protein
MRDATLIELMAAQRSLPRRALLALLGALPAAAASAACTLLSGVDDLVVHQPDGPSPKDAGLEPYGAARPYWGRGRHEAALRPRSVVEVKRRS